jgi:hypothetical protein
MSELSKRRLDALQIAFSTGNPFTRLSARSSGGGAFRRMVDAMTADGYFNDDRLVTVKGLLALRDFHDRRWRRRGCNAYLQHLERVTEAIPAAQAAEAVAAFARTIGRFFADRAQVERRIRERAESLTAWRAFFGDILFGKGPDELDNPACREAARHILSGDNETLRAFVEAIVDKEMSL